MFVLSIHDDDILEFPVEWHDAIRKHLARAFVGTYTDADFDNFDASRYYVRLRNNISPFCLETFSCRARIGQVVDGFPSTLRADGSYYFDNGYREATLPIQFGTVVKWTQMCRINPYITSGDGHVWHWSIGGRKRYIDVGSDRSTDFHVNLHIRYGQILRVT